MKMQKRLSNLKGRMDRRSLAGQDAKNYVAPKPSFLDKFLFFKG